MTQPLAGVRVLEAATLLAGPLAASLLGEFGADVVKVEEPGHGDPVRAFPPLVDGESAQWPMVGRNKSSVTLDLRQDEGAAAFRRLARAADVVVTNFRPGTLREYGIDFDDLCAERPDLVMVHVTAFGRSGPYADRPGFARIAEAFAGLTGRTGEPDGPPMFAGYPVADGTTGVYAAFAAMLALRQRDRSGAPQLVDIALYEPVLRMMEDFVSDYGATGAVAGREGNANPKISPNGLYRTADGRDIVLPASTERMWQRLLPFLDDPELAALDGFEQRVAHRDLVEKRVAEFTGRYRLADLLAMLGDAGVACGPVNDVSDICADPQIRARASVVEVEDPRNGRRHLMQAPAGRFSTFEATVRSAGARLGEHTDELLQELAGYGPAELADLRSRGII